MDAMTSASPANPASRAGTRVPLPYWVRHFALIRPAAITFAVTAAVTVAAVVTSYWKLYEARQQELRAQGTRDAERRRFVHVEAEKQDIRIYQPLYVELRRRGFVGTENRLEWVEAIRQIQEARHLLPLTYQIEPQQPYRLAGPVATGDYQLRGSRMQVHMDLLHEMDLINFLVDLRQRGVFTVQECSIKRTASAANAPLAPALSADCTLNWLTLTTPAAPRHQGMP